MPLMARPHIGWLRTILAAVTAMTAVASTSVAQPAFAPPADFGASGIDASASHIEVSLVADREAVAPGGQLWLAVVLDHAEGWHSQVRAEDLNVKGLVPTTVAVTPTAGEVALGPVQWPEAHMIDATNLYLEGGITDLPVYEGVAPILIPVIVSGDLKPGDAVAFDVVVDYQICDDFECEAPATAAYAITLDVVDPTSAVASPAVAERYPDAFAGADASAFAGASEWAGEIVAGAAEASAGGASFFGFKVPSPDTPLGIAMIALLAIVGGLVLNLTPCVLPVIPIKVMTLSHHAGTPGKSLVLGLAMAIGVIAFWFGIGLPAALFAGFADPSIIFGYWWLTLAIGLIIAVMGVGIMGAFAINLPQSVYKVNPTADSLHGSFLFGVMTGVLGLPCFGFVAGALLPAAAALESPAFIVAIFAAIGVGMALPYLVLAAKPSWVDKIPRTGPASELVKQIMGLLLIAAAAYFIGAGLLALIGSANLPWWGRVVHWWLIGLTAAAAGLWLIARTFAITPKAIQRVSMAIVALVIGGGGVAAAAQQTNHAFHDPWTPFTQEALDETLAGGGVVVLDFTAEWCLNCKALEAGVLLSDPVKPQLLSAGVLPLKADLTSKSASGWAKLRELGQTGIPTLAIFGPGLDQPWVANAYTSAQVLDAIAQARGAGVALADD